MYSLLKLYLLDIAPTFLWHLYACQLASGLHLHHYRYRSCFRHLSVRLSWIRWNLVLQSYLNYLNGFGPIDYLRMLVLDVALPDGRSVKSTNRSVSVLDYYDCYYYYYYYYIAIIYQ